MSGAQGGSLGRGGKNRFATEFEKAAYALKVGEVSQPVLTPFGYHLIRVDEHKGDTLALRHILVNIQASDTATTRIDKEADALSKAAGSSEQGAKLDTAAKKLGLTISHVQAFEGEPAVMNGVVVPSASAWAFGGARVGETSDLFDDDNGYFMARLDSIREGGDAKFENVKADVRARVAVQQQLDKLLPEAQRISSAAATSSLEAAAQQANKKIEKTPDVRALVDRARDRAVHGSGGCGVWPCRPARSAQPVKTQEGVYVLRVDKRVVSDSTAWGAQKEAQKTGRLQQLRQQKIQMFLQDLRKAAKVDDRRKQINAATRRAEV